MEIKTFEPSYLQGAKEALKSAFFREESHGFYNEWEFAERLLESDGYLPELCVIALDGDKVTGYCAVTKAEIGGRSGLALGPLGVREEYQNRGVGSALVRECVRRAEGLHEPWIVLLGGEFYTRFGFESGKSYGIWVSENGFENDHIQIKFLSCGERPSGRVVYCGAFYDSEGNLL